MGPDLEKKKKKKWEKNEKKKKKKQWKTKPRQNSHFLSEKNP